MTTNPWRREKAHRHYICSECGQDIEQGSRFLLHKLTKARVHPACEPKP